VKTKHTVIGVAVSAAATLLAACAPPPVPPAGWNQMFLTRDGADVTSIQVDPRGSVRVSAPTSNRGSDSRTLLWRTSAPATRDHVSCTTTTHTGLPIQEGVALRLARSTDGSSVRGITVQKNIAFGLDWIYNVHLWDTSRPRRDGTLGSSLALLAQFDMHEVIPARTDRDQARRLCARVTGDVVELKVWVPRLPEPDWDDDRHVRSVRLPAGWRHVGRPGLYVAHVPSGGRVTMTDVSQG
jgi:hypothetical protein